MQPCCPIRNDSDSIAAIVVARVLETCYHSQVGVQALNSYPRSCLQNVGKLRVRPGVAHACLLAVLASMPRTPPTPPAAALEERVQTQQTPTLSSFLSALESSAPLRPAPHLSSTALRVLDGAVLGQPSSAAISFLTDAVLSNLWKFVSDGNRSRVACTSRTMYYYRADRLAQDPNIIVHEWQTNTQTAASRVTPVTPDNLDCSH